MLSVFSLLSYNSKAANARVTNNERLHREISTIFRNDVVSIFQVFVEFIKYINFSESINHVNITTRKRSYIIVLSNYHVSD